MTTFNEFLGQVVYDVLDRDDEAFERAGGIVARNCDAIRDQFGGSCPDHDPIEDEAAS